MMLSIIRKQLSPAQSQKLLQFLATCPFSRTSTLSPSFSSIESNLTYAEELSKHRMKLPLYDLEPRVENCWVAPNATLGNLLSVISSGRGTRQEVGYYLV
jgi:hypothetical protein